MTGFQRRPLRDWGGMIQQWLVSELQRNKLHGTGAGNMMILPLPAPVPLGARTLLLVDGWQHQSYQTIWLGSLSRSPNRDFLPLLGQKHLQSRFGDKPLQFCFGLVLSLKRGCVNLGASTSTICNILLVLVLCSVVALLFGFGGCCQTLLLLWLLSSF